MDEILVSAYQTRLIAWNAMLSAAGVSTSGRGLSDAAGDIAGMAEMVSAHADTVDAGIAEALSCLDQFTALFDTSDASSAPLCDRIALLRGELERVGARLKNAIESLPDSMNREAGKVSIDRIQLECLIRQALVNARDRLRAALLALNALDDAVQKEGVAMLETIDTDRLVDSVRHRLAVLSRDASLGAEIRQEGSG